ncbi:hypothetical protein D3C78_1458810 [compost metagenome]
MYRQLVNSTLERDALMCPQQGVHAGMLTPAKRARYFKLERYWLAGSGGKWVKSSQDRREVDRHV